MDKEAENRILAQATAKDDAKAITNTSIGYAVTLIMDYGNGRQVTIAATLPLHATKEQFDAELDKLRLATNRQQAFVIKRDNESQLAVGEKTVAALELMIKTYTEDAEAEMLKLSQGETAKHTITKQQIVNMRQQVSNYTQTKKEELLRAKGNVEICKAVIAGCNKEIEA